MAFLEELRHWLVFSTLRLSDSGHAVDLYVLFPVELNNPNLTNEKNPEFFKIRFVFTIKNLNCLSKFLNIFRIRILRI